MSSDPYADLFSPWVMRSAWRRVLGWYRGGEWADPAEVLYWEADPWSRLEELAGQLAHGSYTPEPCPMVPMPKKNDATRHYVMPTVRDQVAFASFIVLLGPFLEARMPNVSMGNRLFRPRVLLPGGDDGAVRWFRSPYALGHGHIYDRFGAGYGLFRRLLQWVVNSALLGKDARDLAEGELELEDPQALPYRVGNAPKWDDSGALHYARLDLASAYPSVSREQLGRDLQVLLRDDTADHDNASGWDHPAFPSLERSGQFGSTIEPKRDVVAGGHPWWVLREDEGLRQGVAARLARALGAARYVRWEEPGNGAPDTTPADLSDGGALRRDAGSSDRGEPDAYDTAGVWRADCHLSELAGYLSSDQFGLPTGLTASGLLLNVALTAVDEAMCAHYTESNRTGAVYLRFVDDIVLIAPTADALTEALRELHRSLKGTGHHFRPNLGKVKPEGLRDYVKALWSDDAQELPPFPDRPSVRLTRANAEMFTTELVREMSELGNESLDERFGPVATDRVFQLLDMAHRKQDDDEVAADSRVSFAISRLCRAAWPHGNVAHGEFEFTATQVAQRVLLGVERAVRMHPWRFKLWRPALVAAVRASHPSSETDSCLGAQTLRQTLPLVAWSRVDDTESQSWESCYPAEPDFEREPPPDGLRCEALQRRRYEHRRLRASFHRAHFWRQWAGVVRALQQYAGDPGDPSSVRSSWWGDLLTREEALVALGWLADFGAWAGILYDSPGAEYWGEGNPFLWWWEAEALLDAALAVSPPNGPLFDSLGIPAAGALRDGRGLRGAVESLLTGAAWDAKDLLSALGNVLQPSPSTPPARRPVARRRPLYSILWWVRCQSRPTEHGVSPGDDAFAAHRPSRMSGAALAQVTRVGLWLRWPDLAEVVGKAPDMPRREASRSYSVWDRIWRLDTYHHVRRAWLGLGKVLTWWTCSSTFPEIPRPPKGTAPAGKSLLQAMYAFAGTGDVAPADAEVPCLPLPGPTAAGVTYDAKAALATPGGFVTPDTVILSDAVFGAIHGFRCGLVDRDGHGSATLDEVVGGLRTYDKNVTVTPLQSGSRAPHALYLLPELLFDPGAVAEEWRLALLLLWMAGGGEHVLDRLQHWAPWHMPLSERHDVRCALQFPQDIWDWVEWALRSADARTRRLPSQSGRISSDLPSVSGDGLPLTTIELREGLDWDVLWGGSEVAPPEPANLLEDLEVWILQIRDEPDMKRLLGGCGVPALCEDPQTFAGNVQEVSARLAQVRWEVRPRRVLPPSEVEPRGTPPRNHVVLLPEWGVPRTEVRRLRAYVKKSGVGVVAGLSPFEAPPVVRTAARRGHGVLRLLVNEAIVLVPDTSTRRPPPTIATSIVEYRVRKPYASALEQGLVKALADLSVTADRWRFARGHQWVCVAHPAWGPFSVAICSDIIDTHVWDWLRGRLLHLFVVACNTDVELFDQMTRTRGYELLANVAMANRGRYGGSVAWSPRHGHDKLIVHLHGVDQSLMAQACLPVQALAEWQGNGLAEGVRDAQRVWLQKVAPGTPGASQNGDGREREFKTPPPAYTKRW